MSCGADRTRPASVALTDRPWHRVATVNSVGRARRFRTARIEPSTVLGTAGPEAVQITGLIRFRQPCFLDITYTPGYVSRFLPGTFAVWAAGLIVIFEPVAVWSAVETRQAIF